MTRNALYAGLDVGTSGLRLVVCDRRGESCISTSRSWPGGVMPDRADNWWGMARGLLEELPPTVRADLAAIAVDGTSGTVLLATPEGRALGPAMAYNQPADAAAQQRLDALAPAQSAARGSGSGLARAVSLFERMPPSGELRVANQADWLAAQLLGALRYTDENNALKLGYDPVSRCWPDWVLACGLPPEAFLTVRAPGEVLGTLAPGVVRDTGLPAHCRVVAGTTDSIAGFLATGAHQIGDAVTSLGTTLAVKLLTGEPVFSAAHGVYSHRLGDLFLAGGASNSGAGVLANFFTGPELEALSCRLQPNRPTGLDYYPLSRPGERFPIHDPGLLPRLQPRPADDAVFLQGMLEGIARIEARAYARLNEMGCPPPHRIITVGGGAANEAWRQIRQRELGVEVVNLAAAEPALGVARLAARAPETGRDT